MLKLELNYVKSRIREAAAQAHPESPPRPTTYSWTAAFVLGASFAVPNCVACVSTCVRAETGNQRSLRLEFSACAKRHHATDNNCGPAPQAHGSLSMRTQNPAPPDGLMHTKIPAWIAIHAQEDMDLNRDQQTSSCDKKLLRSSAASTLGSHPVRKETSSCDKTAAFSRRKHTWISLRAHRDMFRQKDCCDLAPLVI